MKKFIALLLCMLTVFTVACTNPDNSSSNVTPSDDSSVSDSSQYEGTGNYLIKNGKNTGYKIVVEDDASSDINLAVSELNHFMEEATGVSFDVIGDSQATWSAHAQYISIGRTELMESADITLSTELGNDGTQVVTKNKSLFLTGQTDIASLYAVYDFLHDALNYEFFYTDCYSLDKNVTDLELRAYNFTNVPDIPYRTSNYGFQDDTLTAKRMRVVHYFSPFVDTAGFRVHNSFKYVQGQDSGHESYWYATSGTQLCYTARGNEVEYEALQNACFASLKKWLIADPTKTIVTFTQEDMGTFCTCEACVQVKAKYGAASALLILFMNDLRDKIDAWFVSEEGAPYKRDLNLLFFAYQDTVDAPASFDEVKQQWVPNEGIHCKDGVSVYYAPIQADYTRSIYDVNNKTIYDNIKAWSTVSAELFLWFYSTMFFNYQSWYDTFNGMQDYYKVAKEANAAYLFDQAQSTCKEGAYAWGTLKAYLNAKLAWDVNADMGELTEAFFETYYGPVSEQMLNFFKKHRVYTQYLIDNTPYSCYMSCHYRSDKAEYWPKHLLLTWLDEMNSIIGELDVLKKTDRKAYDDYYYRIANERLTIYWMLVEFYSSTITPEEVLNYKLQYKSDASYFGYVRRSEAGIQMDALYEQWGV